MVEIKYTGDALWERIERAVEKVKERLRRVAEALNTAGVPYAVIGGNAVQYWVAQVDESAIRNTRDVDIIIRRSDLPAAIRALAGAGFHYHPTAGTTTFLDGPDAKAWDAVHIFFAGETVTGKYPEAIPSIDDVVALGNARTLPLESLVRTKLVLFRDKDRVHLADLIFVGMIDETWLDRFTPPLRERLKELLDNPDG